MRPVYLPLDPASRTTWFRRPHRAADPAGVSARKPQLGGHGLVAGEGHVDWKLAELELIAG